MSTNERRSPPREAPSDSSDSMRVLKERDPNLFAAWEEWTGRSSSHLELDPRTKELIAIAIDCIVHRPPQFHDAGAMQRLQLERRAIDAHYHAALESGSNVRELIAVVMLAAQLKGGLHAMQDGLAAVERVVSDRKARGLLTPDGARPAVGRS